MQLEISPLVETLDIKISDKVIPLNIDLSDEGRARISAAFIGNSKKLEAQELLFDKAKANGNEVEADRARLKMADLIEECFVITVGKDAYDALIDAITKGDRSKRPYCISALTNVMRGMSQVYATANEQNAHARSLGKLAEEMTAMRDSEGDDVAQSVPFEVVR